jgi:DNA-directed RNA polymerase specialized sigma24 family protein
MSPVAKNAALGALLAHRENAKLICWTLLRNGYSRQDVQDGLQDVYVKALESFQRKAPPDTLERMMALCAEIAKNHAIDELRKERTRKADLAAKCKRKEYGWIEREPVSRDPVDAARQLEVLADLFRKGRMPEHGVDILHGVVLGRTFGQIAEACGISEELAKWRMREMKRIFRVRLAELGMIPGMKPLRLIVSEPSAIALLREAA